MSNTYVRERLLIRLTQRRYSRFVAVASYRSRRQRHPAARGRTRLTDDDVRPASS